MTAQVALAGVQGIMKMQAARTQAKGLAAQATMARLQAKQESLKYKQQGVNVLENILRTSAAITARAGAGGIDPFTGSAANLARYALSKGVQELYTVQDNELITIRGGEMQAGQYMAQAKGLMQGAMMSAAFGVAGAALKPDPGGPTPTSGLQSGASGSGTYLRTGMTSGTRPTLDPLKMVFS